MQLIISSASPLTHVDNQMCAVNIAVNFALPINSKRTAHEKHEANSKIIDGACKIRISTALRKWPRFFILIVLHYANKFFPRLIYDFQHVDVAAATSINQFDAFVVPQPNSRSPTVLAMVSPESLIFFFQPPMHKHIAVT